MPLREEFKNIPNTDTPGITANELDKFDNTTYHFRLYISREMPTPTLLPNNKTVWPESNPQSILLAETASTRVAIDDVAITTLACASTETKTSVSKKIEFQLHEASSVKFFDNLAAAARKLGVKQFTMATYYFELSFKGRDPITSMPINPDGSIFAKKWIWPMFITSINTNITASGATYNVTALPTDQIAYTDSLGILSKDFVAEGVKTAQDVMNKMAEEYNNPKAAALNPPNKQEDEDTQGKNVEHANLRKNNFLEFDFSQMKQSDLELMTKKELINRSDLSDNIKQTKDDTLTLTFAKGTSYVDIIDITMSITRKAHTIAKESKEAQKAKANGEPVANDNFIVKNLYRIEARTAPRYNEQLSNSTGDYPKHIKYYVLDYKYPSVRDASNDDKDPTLLAEVRKNIRKAYFYNFTGLNSQVIDFDIQFNFAFQFPIPEAAGIDRNDANTITQNASKQTGNPDYFSKNSGIKALPALVAPELESIPGSGVISYGTIDSNRLDSSGGDGPPDNSRTFFNTLLSQAYMQGSGYGGDLLEVEMKIKGDPFWLGPAYPVSITSIDRLAYEPPIIGTQLNIGDMPPMFLIQVLVPDEADQDTGIVRDSARRNNETIGGLYHVREIEQNFTNGEFNQVLKAFRSVRTPIDQVNKLIQSAKKKLGILNTNE